MQLLDVLTDLALTGSIGPAACGARLDDIIEVYGDPWDVGTMGGRRRWPRLFAYSDLELNVCECRLVTLMCVQTWRETVTLPSEKKWPQAFESGLTYDEVAVGLERAGCPWEPYPPLTLPGQTSLVAGPASATFTFEILESSEPILNIVGVVGAAHDCSA